MPFLEQAELTRVAKPGGEDCARVSPAVDDGYTVITLTASCGLMLKFEWPLLLPDNEDVKALAAAVMDIDQFIVDIAKNEGLAPGLKPVEGGVTRASGVSRARAKCRAESGRDAEARFRTPKSRWSSAARAMAARSAYSSGRMRSR